MCVYEYLRIYVQIASNCQTMNRNLVSVGMTMVQSHGAYKSEHSHQLEVEMA